ncbi:MAG TPA: hypothetical protein VFK04_12915 [Gemmatimonadaceae bacterium]|nr:hypothetical protein [Gemmatimonadaceae bacterium]
MSDQPVSPERARRIAEFEAMAAESEARWERTAHKLADFLGVPVDVLRGPGDPAPLPLDIVALRAEYEAAKKIGAPWPPKDTEG